MKASEYKLTTSQKINKIMKKHMHMKKTFQVPRTAKRSATVYKTGGDVKTLLEEDRSL